jgi:probable phosphoglycerate mutase
MPVGKKVRATGRYPPGRKEAMAELQAAELVVVRHGETVWNLFGKQQGWLDSELSELGRAQAEAIADALVGEQFDALYSSDLGRAMQTAGIIAARLGRDIVPDARLRERRLGIIQGMTMAEFEQSRPKEYALFRGGDPDYAIPDGESARQRHQRCVACAAEIAARHAGRTVLIVAHGGILDSFFRHAMGLDLGAPRCFSLYNASISTFIVAGGQWKLGRWDDTHHLKRLGTQDDW